MHTISSLLRTFYAHDRHPDTAKRARRTPVVYVVCTRSRRCTCHAHDQQPITYVPCTRSTARRGREGSLHPCHARSTHTTGSPLCTFHAHDRRPDTTEGAGRPTVRPAGRRFATASPPHPQHSPSQHLTAPSTLRPPHQHTATQPHTTPHNSAVTACRRTPHGRSRLRTRD